MIVVGGLTRLTDSGLSITKWELIKGILPPLNDQQWLNYFNEYKKIPEFTLVNSNITLAEFKIIFYWEYAHRLLGRLIGIVSIFPLLFFIYKYKNYNFNLKKFFLIPILISFQGIIGWYMVESGLVDRVDVSHFRLAAHLLLAFIILSLIYWFILDLNKIKTFENKISNIFLSTILCLLGLQILFGAFLAGMDGGLIYQTWPDMNGSFFPDDTNVYLMFTSDTLNNPSIVQFIHRTIAYVIIVLIIYLNYIYFKNNLPLAYIIVFDFFICLQIFLGIITLISGVPISYASLHQIGSIFVLISFLLIFYKNLKLTNSF
tara:strand:+ start:309 stop:1259 length:951 start_codon:yes stop_codon:yes gene_type:complete